MQFRASRESEEWKGKRLAAQERQRLNDAPHLLSRSGYAKLEKKLRKSRADALGLESPDLAPAPHRYELWKAARTKSDGNMTSSSAALISQRIDELVEQQTQGTFVGQGRDDILTTAIGRPEHPGRVCGVLGAIGLRDYFGPTQKTPPPPSMSQETLRQMDLQWEERLNQSMRSMEQRFMEQLQEQKEIQRALEEKLHSMMQGNMGAAETPTPPRFTFSANNTHTSRPSPFHVQQLQREWKQKHWREERICSTVQHLEEANDPAAWSWNNHYLGVKRDGKAAGWKKKLIHAAATITSSWEKMRRHGFEKQCSKPRPKEHLFEERRVGLRKSTSSSFEEALGPLLHQQAQQTEAKKKVSCNVIEEGRKARRHNVQQLSLMKKSSHISRELKKVFNLWETKTKPATNQNEQQTSYGNVSERIGYKMEQQVDPPRIVAVGRVLEGGQTIHGVLILPQQVPVTIDKVRDPQAQVPVPTPEINFVGEAIRSFIAWPRALIMSHIATPQKQPIHDRIIHEDDDMAEAEDDPLSKLMTRLPRLKKAPLELYWDLRVFGLPPNVPVYITLSDALEMIGGDRILNISIIQLWCMYMDTIVVEQGRSSVYGFVEPQTIQPFGNTLQNRQHYLQTWMDESKRDVYLVPYIDGKMKNDLRTMLQGVIGKSRGQLVQILYPKCNQQLDSWECGFYVMCWIKTIIRAVITDDWNERFKSTLPIPEDTIRQIRLEWTAYLLQRWS
ncbi:hypothetical protein LR48_Vigan10s001400 [Vigna angularis]|uniref:DUF8039 domain-containing protein n=1 Tax=Phaseolus angularis TaxID=3914 RepID=A0A0L9T2S3_PHAAN|nr:hypothetical protein LR48_Vigan10s001400 [Vigna angularis]